MKNKKRYKNKSNIANQVNDNNEQLKQEVALLLIELKAYASQSSPLQKIKSITQNQLRLKEVDFLTEKKKAS